MCLESLNCRQCYALKGFVSKMTIKERGHLFWITDTTRFHSFTDGKIPSVCDQKFVGDFFTDVITDGLSPSVFPSSVIPHSVAISVGKTKKPFADGFTDEICAPKKKDSHLKYTTGFLVRRYIVIYRRKLSVGKSVGECMKYRQNMSVCKFVGNCGSYC